MYKFVPSMLTLVPYGAPSRAQRGLDPSIRIRASLPISLSVSMLTQRSTPRTAVVHCKTLKIDGPVVLAKGVVFKGDVKVVNKGSEAKKLKAGVYENCTIDEASASLVPLKKWYYLYLF